MTSISKCPGFPGFLDPWTPGNPGTRPCLTAVRRHVGVSGETRRRFQLNASRRRHLTQNLLYLQLDKFTTPLGSNRSQRSAKAQCRARLSHATHAGPRLNQGFRRPRDRAGTTPTKNCPRESPMLDAPGTPRTGGRAPRTGSPPGVAQAQCNNSISTPGC